MKDGLSQPSVMCIYQDTLRRMWFGTVEGVNIYDGQKIVRLMTQNINLKSDEQYIIGRKARRILGSCTGDVYLLIGQSLFRYDIHKEHFTKLMNRDVKMVANSRDKHLWIATFDSLYHYDVNTGVAQPKRKLKVGTTTSLLHSDEKTLYVGSKTGLYKLDIPSDEMTKVIDNPDISHLFYSSNHTLWVGTQNNGLYTIDSDGVVHKAPMSPTQVVDSQIREFVEDDEHNIWFGTFNGLQKYNPKTDTYEVFKANNQPGDLAHSSVFSLYKDKQGTIWVGTYYGGVDYCNPKKDIFTYYPSSDSNNECLNFPIVGEMLEDKEHNLWVATDGGGLNCLDKDRKHFTYITSQGKNHILHNNVKTIAYDEKRDHIYIGTHTGGLSRLDRKTGRVLNYMEQPGFVGPSGIVFHIEFYKDKLYISSRNGLWELNPETGIFKKLHFGEYVINFKIDNHGYIWMNSISEVIVMDMEERTNQKYYHLKDFIDSNATITNIVQDKEGRIYVTTSGSGLYTFDIDTRKFRHYTQKENNLLSDFCYNVIETPNKNVLVTTEKGVSIYSPVTKQVHSIELNHKGSISSITNGCGAYVTEDGMIYIGGVDGMVSFNENDFFAESSQKNHTKLYFSKLRVNNVEVYPNDDTRILSMALPFTDKIKLSHNQNNVIVNFSNSNYVWLYKNGRYQYKLEGFDNDWITTSQNALHYTNLPSGSYVLKVRELYNLSNKGYGHEIALKIEVLTPWFKSIWAYLGYVLVLAGAIYLILRFKMSRNLYELTIQQERKEKERMEEMNKLKLRFFTNISHEFRTPLTLIIGQLEVLMYDRDLSLSIKRKVQRMYRSSILMRKLITELLDFRKQEQGFMKLKVKEYNLVSFVNDIFILFKDYAQRRCINYTFTYSDQDIMKVWFDAEQFQKVLFNLLSNAFKYTPRYGTIMIAMKTSVNQTVIEVKDSGCGISPEYLKDIFTRYYQAENSTTLEPGTGIGLALTKGIIDLHKGKIEVESTPNKGSVFRIILQNGNAHFSSEELVSDEVTIFDQDYTNERNKLDIGVILGDDSIAVTNQGMDEDMNEEVDENLENDDEKPTMLLVEDDTDIINMLEEVFAHMYKILKAGNGKEGFELAREKHPDIIISDVMMPEMSGKEMCYEIKNCIEISHIPVILLTAQIAVEQTIEGYAYGADDYVTKPFNVKILAAKCRSLLNNRKNIMRMVEPTVPVQELVSDTPIVMNSADRRLVEQATKIIKDNFSNPDFNMNMLAAELNIGRSKLYSRFKEVQKITPNEYTLRLKLQEGMKLLKDSPELNISEISYRLGFTSLRYFSKCFKTFCGVSPQNYRKNLNVK